MEGLLSITLHDCAGRKGRYACALYNKVCSACMMASTDQCKLQFTSIEFEHALIAGLAMRVKQSMLLLYRSNPRRTEVCKVGRSCAQVSSDFNQYDFSTL